MTLEDIGLFHLHLLIIYWCCIFMVLIGTVVLILNRIVPYFTFWSWSSYKESHCIIPVLWILSVVEILSCSWSQLVLWLLIYLCISYLLIIRSTDIFGLALLFYTGIEAFTETIFFNMVQQISLYIQTLRLFRRNNFLSDCSTVDGILFVFHILNFLHVFLVKNLCQFFNVLDHLRGLRLLADLGILWLVISTLPI